LLLYRCMAGPNPSVVQELREQAADALRMAALVPEGTRAALLKLSADLLATAAELEKGAVMAPAPEDPIEETRTAPSPKADT
jgi:hypothetical protein